MATFSKQLLSASTDGRAIKVAATSIASTPTLIHTGSSTASTFEEVWIYAQNNNSADVALRLGFGGVTDPDDIIEYTVKTKGGLYLIVPGLILKGNASAALTIRAAAATANVISLSGYVNRITA
jgi:hypothetical protein